MSRSQYEIDAIKMVLCFGEVYGYGNLISCLKRAWAKSLVVNWRISLCAAKRGADTEGFTTLTELAFDAGDITIDELIVF